MTTLTERPTEQRTPPLERTAGPASPAGTPSRARRVAGWFSRHRSTLVWLLPVLAIAAVVQALNLDGSPQRIDDEGTYTAQAWAILNLGELAHYTFWYDHPPVGWIQIAGYAGLTGAFERYDISVIAAREAMLVATLVSVALLWFLARRVGLSRAAASAAGLVFALSPLAVQFHRTVYLDNVATPWLLASVLLALTRKHQLAGFAGSAAAFGIAVLSKETYLLALPLIGWLMWRAASPATRRYTLSVAASILVLIGTGYIAFALVKGELTPGADRVSLFDGLAFQLASRESSGSILDPESLFSATAGVWWQLDPVLVVAAPLATLAAFTVRRLRPFAFFLAFLIAFMFRPGGYLPVPYIVMLLPFAALLIAGVTDSAVRSIRVRRGVRRVPAVVWLVAAVTGLALLVPTWSTQLRGFLLSDLDAPSRAAQAWVADNVDRDSRLIVDDAMWVDLVTTGFARENVVWFYKLDTDPAVQAQSPNGWRDSDFVITTDSMVTSPSAESANQAIDNSVVVASFGEGDQTVEVREIVPAGIDTIDPDAESAERAALGSDIALNPGLDATERDLARLRAGQIDERVVITLTQLLSAGTVTVGDFPIVDGEDGQVFRQVLVEGAGEVPLTDNGAPTAAAESLLAPVDGRFGPERVEAVDGGLLLTFSIVAPPGLVQ